MSLGKEQSEEVLEYVFNEIKDATQLKKLFIDLSPFNKTTL